MLVPSDKSIIGLQERVGKYYQVKKCPTDRLKQNKWCNEINQTVLQQRISSGVCVLKFFLP